MPQVSAISQQVWDMKYRFKAGDGTPVDRDFADSWARVAMAFEVIQEKDAVEIVCTGDGVTKRVRFAEDASITVSWSWDPAAFAATSRFTSECSFFRPLEIEAVPAATKWVAPVETVAKSEKGLDRTVQGESVTLLWNAAVGSAKLVVRRIR